ncbi:MAG: LuxR C-terminal-related transcriptional regulator [Actinomycetota bacterium]
MDSAQIDRGAQAQVLRTVVDTARGGTSAVLVVVGDAGLGKTSVLDEVESLAGDVTVLRAHAVDFESAVPFAALQHLLAPRLPLLAGLPAPLRGALEAALEVRPGRPDPFRTGLGVVGLLAAVTPTICLIDDAHHLDAASAEALAVAARRLGRAPVALVFAGRPNRSLAMLDGLPRLELTPLSHTGSRRLLTAALRAPIDDAVRDQLVCEARGVPAAVTDVVRGLRHTADLAGGFALPGALRPPAALVDEYRARLAAVPAGVRRFTLIAAADPTGDPALLWRAAQMAGVYGAGSAAAVAVSMSIGRRILFPGPLVRSAIYHAADAGEKREIHAVLAAATDALRAADRRAWHRALAVMAPDAEASHGLEHAVPAARSTGGVAAVAAFLERAAALTDDAGQRFALTLAAAAAKLDAGDVDAAAELSGAARLDVAEQTQTAQLAAFEARVAFARTRRAQEAQRLVEAVTQLSRHEPATDASVRLHALVATYWTGSEETGAAHREQLLDSDRDAGDPASAELAALVSPALAEAMFGDRAAAVPLARRAVTALLERADEPEGLDPASAWIMCSIAWDDEALATILDRQLAAVRGAGSVGALPIALTSRALLHLHAGELDRATRCLREATQLSSVVPELVELGVAAWRGDRGTVGELSGRMTDATPEGLGPRQAAAVSYARLLLHNGAGTYAQALDSIDIASGTDELGFHVFVPAELVEAAVFGGQRELAGELTMRLDAHTDAAGTPWALGLRARCRALIADGPEAEDLFANSVDHLRRSATPIQLARSQLLLGEWLRRRQRRTEARAALREAFDVFSSAGATLFAKRAARELRAAGQLAPRTRDRLGLSDQELAVAVRVAEGKTSKEVAAELVLSPRTVDAHLRSIFAKLGVKSRRDIRYALPSAMAAQRGGSAKTT